MNIAHQLEYQIIETEKKTLQPPMITNGTFMAVLVFELLSRRVLFISGKDNRNC